jgi:hypothetical protein
MGTTHRNIQKIGQLVSGLKSDILVCSGSLGSVLQESILFDFSSLDNTLNLIPSGEKYKIGNFLNKKDVFVDPYMKWNDIRILDNEKNELINLADLGFEINDFM